jgi:hypothetical protein
MGKSSNYMTRDKEYQVTNFENSMEFREDLHEYTFKGVKYSSMTRVVSSMEEHTDFNKIAEEYVKKHSRETILKKLSESWKISLKESKEKWGDTEFTKDTILKIWKDKSDYAKKVGTGYHKFKEDSLIKESKDLGKKVFTQQEDKGIKYSFDLSNLEPGIYPEMILYDHDHLITGTSDIVIIDGKYIDIEDHKTSEEITTKGTAYFRPELGRKTVKMLMTPLSHLEDINFNHYALQLSGYAYMLERYGYIPRKLQINHVIFESKDLGIVKEVVPYQIPYLKKEVIAMFKHFKNKLNK